MKKNNLIFVFVVFIVTACSSHFEMNERDRAVNHMMLEFAETVSENGLCLIGIGGGINHDTGKYNELGISFFIQEGIKDINRARVLFVETTDAFLSFINTNENIREYLDVFPITILNIRVSILCPNAQSGEIVSVSNHKSCVYYCTESANPDQDPWNEVLNETFEEAHCRLCNTF